MIDNSLVTAPRCHYVSPYYKHDRQCEKLSYDGMHHYGDWSGFLCRKHAGYFQHHTDVEVLLKATRPKKGAPALKLSERG